MKLIHYLRTKSSSSALAYDFAAAMPSSSAYAKRKMAVA